MANALVVWVDGIFIGAWDDHTHGQGNATAVLPFDSDKFSEGHHFIEILSIGLGNDNANGPNAGGRIDTKGIVGQVTIPNNTVSGPWILQKGLAGEFIKIFDKSGASKVQWNAGAPAQKQITWYTTTFTLPNNLPDLVANPLVLDVTGLGRGHAYINGQDIGMYWTLAGKCYSEAPCCCQQSQFNCDQPTQSKYHIPPDWVVTGENTLTIFEEIGATDFSKVKILQRVVAKN